MALDGAKLDQYPEAVSARLIPQSPQGPILIKATRRELLIDIAVRGLLMVVVAGVFLKLRNPISGGVFWPMLIGVEALILVPLVLTIIFRYSPAVAAPTAEEISRLKAFERSANLRAVWVTVLTCSLTYFVVINGWITLLPYVMTLPLLLLWKNPPKRGA
jgi:hypothetical protein